jgi:hypothetical protein
MQRGGGYQGKEGREGRRRMKDAKMDGKGGDD